MKSTKFFRYLFIVFYFFAGINHFVQPNLYWPLIPDYWQNYKEVLNILAGVAEIIVAALMFYNKTTKLSAYLTILMLVAFIPSHVYFIKVGNLTVGAVVISPLIAWIRLLIVHPILIYWAWWLGKNLSTKNTL